MMNSPLTFKNPQFRPGLNVTVRLGHKWLGRASDSATVEVWTAPIGKTAGRYLFDAFIREASSMRVCDIPANLLELEHDPSCRTHKGLIHELARVYRRPISTRAHVTVLVFERLNA